jgi:hypothetical protein
MHVVIELLPCGSPFWYKFQALLVHHPLWMSSDVNLACTLPSSFHMRYYLLLLSIFLGHILLHYFGLPCCLLIMHLSTYAWVSNNLVMSLTINVMIIFITLFSLCLHSNEFGSLAYIFGNLVCCQIIRLLSMFSPLPPASVKLDSQKYLSYCCWSLPFNFSPGDLVHWIFLILLLFFANYRFYDYS